MKKYFQKKLFRSFLILLICSPVLLASCATSVSFPVERPAEIDSKGATSITILPFSSGNMGRFYYNHGTETKIIANYIQEQFQKRILRSGYFSLISSQGLPNTSGASSSSSDLRIQGNIYNFSNKVEKIPVETEDKKRSFIFTNGRLVFR